MAAKEYLPPLSESLSPQKCLQWHEQEKILLITFHFNVAVSKCLSGQLETVSFYEEMKLIKEHCLNVM